MIITILAFIFTIALLAIAHEFGHFFAAKSFGIKVKEFGFGFPPRLWAKKLKETTYSINAIPIGGFVKIYGEEGEGKKDPKSFENKKPWQKFIVLIAGVTMNFILAWLILTVLYFVGFKAIIPGMWDHNGIENNQKVYITQVEENSPAAKKGLLPGDIIKSIEGENVYLEYTVTEIIRSSAKENPEKPIKIIFERDGKTLEKSITAYKASTLENGKKSEVMRIGIIPESRGGIQAKWYLSPIVAFSEAIRLTRLTAEGIYDFFKKAITTFSISENVVGPVGIVQISGSFAAQGIVPLFLFIAILSIALSLTNLLPFYPFDGGHIAFLLTEKVMRRPLTPRAKSAIQIGGLALILILLVFVTLNDLGRWGLFDFLGRVFN